MSKSYQPQISVIFGEVIITLEYDVIIKQHKHRGPEKETEREIKVF